MTPLTAPAGAPAATDFTRQMTPQPVPVARELTMDDLSAALSDAAADFRAAPFYGLAFGGFYTLIGAGALATCIAFGWTHLIVPVISGFLLFGPFAALGLYQVSRMRAAGQPLTPARVFLAFREHGGGQIALFGLVLLCLTILWMQIAAFLYALFFGLSPMPVGTLLASVFTTWNGAEFALLGTLVGAVCALTVFATSVFGMPMLLDARVDVATALIASVATVRANARVMFAWAVMVALLIGCALVFGLVGLVVVLPLVGHGTWHLYARAFHTV